MLSLVMSLTDEDDDAPEEVCASSSRQQGISQLKDIKELLRKSKEEERERRRQRNEMFRIQKVGLLVLCLHTPIHTERGEREGRWETGRRKEEK